jgi:hypothetical protein
VHNIWLHSDPWKLQLVKNELLNTWNAKSLAWLQGFASSILGKCDVNHFYHLPRCADSSISKCNVGNIPVHRIPGLQEACVISNILSFFPKPMKAGPHLWTAFCTVPRESWNTNARWRHSGTGLDNSYSYAESGPFLTLFCAIAEELRTGKRRPPLVCRTLFCAIAAELRTGKRRPPT